MSEVLKRQAGDGTHYTDMKMQPLELAWRIKATPAFTKVAKYTTRVKDDPIEQMDKAIHCCEIEKELNNKYGCYQQTLEVLDSYLHISDFTDNITLQYALQAMYMRQYDVALRYLRDLKEEILCQQS
jgi:hypothetical protein